MKIGDKVFLLRKAYMIWWFLQKFGFVDKTKPMWQIIKEIDKENFGIVKGFQSKEFDGRDVIIRWKDFLWNTAIPSQFLVKTN